MEKEKEKELWENQVEKNKLVTEILEYHSKKINKLEFIIFFLGIAIILLTVKLYF